MSQNRFTDLLALGRPLFVDGAMGTMLQARGMPAGVSPERFVTDRPDVLRGVHGEYIGAGADIILSCTFGGSPFKLDPALDVFEYNRRTALVAREAADMAGRPVCVAGDVGPCGHFSRPLGDLDPEEMIAGYARQIEGLAAGGCDLILVETQFDLAEARAAVMAARRVCSLPVVVSMTFEAGTSLTGSTPEIFCETMLNLGCAAVGTNCSLGPDLMEPVVRELLRRSTVPVMAEPNAGMPQLVDGSTVFPLGPGRFAELTAPFASMGARILGGCCGTTPEHIAALRRAVLSLDLSSGPGVAREERGGIALTTRQQIVRVGEGEPFVVIGERINPTGKKQLTAELQRGVFTTALEFADRQVEAGARVLDVNVGAHAVDESILLPALVGELTSRHTVPLSIDSSGTEPILRALPWVPGSALVNSVNGGGDRMLTVGGACRDAGAPFILLPIRGAKLPVTASERIAILEDLLLQAESLGIPRRLIMVDVLALAVSSKSLGALSCLDLIRYCRENGLPTTLGLSNLSFGLPARELINATFLAMGAGAGLSSAICNPSSARIGEVHAALDVLGDHDSHAENFIAGFSEWKSGESGQGPRRASGSSSASTPFEAVLLGDRDHVEALIDEELTRGTEPFAIVNDGLIPAITEVGVRYEKRQYFLPQLIRSAETMQKGFAHLKPLMKRDDAEERPTIVMATVEGDIHDIGKNIVCLLLGNHGFNVVDAGKDVTAEQIVDCACEHKASIIGLSALMTTTMIRMEDTIRLLKERDLNIRVMVGGAAVTRDFAEAIGADAYCVDAVEAVASARRLLGIA